MKFRKSIIGAILTAVISLTAIAPCNVVYADTSKTASAESNIPTNFKTSKTATSITLSWDAVKGADAYKVYMYNSASGKYEKYKNVTKNSCKITGLSTGTKYYFKVSVLTKNGSTYKEKANSKSKSIAVTTKTSDTKSTKSSDKNTINVFLNLKMGTSEKSVLEKLGIKNYKKVGDSCVHFVDRFGDRMILTEEEYADYVKSNYDMEVKFKSHKIQCEVMFTWKNVDYKSTLSLEFKDKKLASWRLSIPYSEKNDNLVNEIYEYFDKLLGDTYEQTSNDGYIDYEKDDYILISNNGKDKLSIWRTSIYFNELSRTDMLEYPY